MDRISDESVVLDAKMHRHLRGLGALFGVLVVIVCVAVIGLVGVVTHNQRHVGPPPQSVPIGLRITIDGHIPNGTRIPVFVGAHVSIVVTATVPIGAVLDCLLIAPDGYAGGGGCGYEYRGGGSPIFVVHGHFHAGRHSFRVTWRPALDKARALFVNWHVTPPPGTAFTDGIEQTDLPQFTVLPIPVRERTHLRLTSRSPVVTECGLRPAELVPTVLLLDCQAGEAYVVGLRWSQWSIHRAVATGYLSTTDTCVQPGPSNRCQGEGFIGHHVSVVLHMVRASDGHAFFTLATVTYHVAWALHSSVRTFRLS
jgi:hypothetical protein